MNPDKKQTASFMVRFTQHLYEKEDGETNVQWRGRISHIQNGKELNFVEFQEALEFMQEQLATLTLHATKDKSPEEQTSILSDSQSLWKRVTQTGPKLLRDVIKDPKGQFTQFQDQIQDQITSVGDEISTKVPLDQWRVANKQDLKNVAQSIEKLTAEIEALKQKLE